MRRRRAALLVALAALVVAAFAFARFAARVDELRTRRAAGPGWSFPSRVYCDGVALVQGRTMPLSWTLAHLEARGYREVPTAREPGTWARVPHGLEIVLRGFDEAPDPLGSGGPERIRLALAQGRIASVVRLGGLPGAPPPDAAHPPRLEPVLIAHLDDSLRVRRTWVPLARIPRVLQDAVIASEDRRFRGHFGIDPRSNVRALAANVGAGVVRQGGSTITQQVARALFLSQRRTFARKLQEAFIAVGLELLLSKDQILEIYLNSVYWGQGGSAQIAGVAEAALWYFGVPVDSLGLDQAALLAGMIPAPNVYHPLRRPGAARARRDAVLANMVETGKLSAAAAAAARQRAPSVVAGTLVRDRFPSYVGAVRDYLAQRLPQGALETRGLSIFTPLDLVWQDEAEFALAEGVTWVERGLARRAEPLQGAFVAIEPATGFARVVVGGRMSTPGMFNRATRAVRQPGSAIKPIVYAAALDPTRGVPRFTPGTTVSDLRREFQTAEGPWKPRNDEGDYHDTVTLAKALAKSLNLATANLVEAVGPRDVARYAERFGLGKFKPVASIGLGTNEVTLLALVDAYSTFPNGGVRHPATLVRAVLGARGIERAGMTADAVRVLPTETAELMTGLLENVVMFGVSYPLRARWGFMRPTGGKTGTTNDYRDAWFVGFTPDLAAGVWVGWDQPQSLNRPAAETAIPVWANVMSSLLEDFPPKPFSASGRIEQVWIDPWSGGRARSDCPSPLRTPFLKGTAPDRMCSRSHEADWRRIAVDRLADSLRAVVDSSHVDSVAVSP